MTEQFLSVWLTYVAILLIYLAMHGRVAGGTSDQSQPGCVKELHTFLGSQRSVTIPGKSKESHMPEPLCPEPDPPSPTSSTSSEANEPLYFQTSEAVSSLNKCLADIGEMPYSQSRMHQNIKLIMMEIHLPELPTYHHRI